MNQFSIAVIGSIIATVVILLTRLVFYKVRDLFPARTIFRHISGSKIPCCVFILRMTDIERQGRFLAPLPSYAIATHQQEFEPRQLTPWVTSIYEAQSLAHVLNVLGRVGRTKNIEVLYADRDYDKWDVPMFILGGSWKATRAFETCDPLFTFTGDAFLLRPTSESFMPQSAEHDIGLLEKMTNHTTGYPVWIAMGWRGAGTNAATYALAKWWKELGILYGSKNFGLIVGLNDRDGWQQSFVVKLHPMPHWLRKLLHPVAWNKLKRAMIPATQRPESGRNNTEQC